jgi:hypothetical protein
MPSLSRRTGVSGLSVVRHRDFPDIALDNNPAERALRTPVVGRKNYYGSHAKWAAELAARVWTIAATAERKRPRAAGLPDRLPPDVRYSRRQATRRPSPPTIPALATQLGRHRRQPRRQPRAEPDRPARARTVTPNRNPEPRPIPRNPRTRPPPVGPSAYPPTESPNTYVSSEQRTVDQRLPPALSSRRNQERP